MTYQDAVDVADKIWKAGIKCHVDTVRYNNNKEIFYVRDRHNKNVCILESSKPDIEFVMTGQLVFNDGESRMFKRAEPVDLYRFSENAADLNDLTEEFIARYNMCKKVHETFKKEIDKLYRDCKKNLIDEKVLESRVHELNMKTCYDIEAIGCQLNHGRTLNDELI